MTDTLNTLAATSPVAERVLYGVPTQTAVGTVTTGANVATFTGVTGKQWYLCEFTLSFGATTTAASTLTVKDGSTTIYQIDLPTLTNPAPIQFRFDKRPLHASTGAALTINLSSPGTITSTISASAFTVIAP